MPGYIEALGQQMGGSTAGGILGLMFGGLQNQQNMNQARRMQSLNKDMYNYQMQKQLEMWRATSYPAQVEQLIKAGLNPGLLYGMSGGGSTTTGTAQQGNAQAAPQMGGIMGMQMGAQMGLLKAQAENIKADTELKKVDAAKKAGVDTEHTKAQITQLALNNEFLAKTMNDRVDIINSEMGKLINELTLQDGAIARERGTRTADIQKAMTEAANALLTSQLIEVQIKEKGQNIEESKAAVIRMGAEINKWAQEIAQEWTGLNRQERELKLKGWEAQMKAKYPGLFNVLGRAANETANGIGRLFGAGPGDTEKEPPIHK